MNVSCEVSLGELVDKISILEVKKKNIEEREKLSFVEVELSVLRQTLDKLDLEGVSDYLRELVDVNSALWKIEDDIRDKEREGSFDQGFIDLARAVYRQNDRRFAIKNRINEFYGSGLREVKSYQKYE